ncbi:MAG: DNA repair protein RadA [Gemmatimonadota bacterium]
MAVARTVFFCTTCGGESLRWEGRCPTCGEWNSLVETPRVEGHRGRGPAADARGPVRPLDAPAPLSSASAAARRPVGYGELDRVLGGGLVPGSVLLLGGMPGIGKSTLLLHAAAGVRERGGSVLYVSGEESRGQVAVRASRLGGAAVEVTFLAATGVEEIVAAAEEVGPELLCVDSVQTLVSGRLPSGPGSVAQVRECAAGLQEYAKRSGTATFLVGHVTKGGALAGPRALEHLVDVVLHFEGQRSLECRVLRATKNRFGSVEEVAVFRMTGTGLEPVLDPSGLFLTDRSPEVSGSAIAVPLQGTRPLVAEVQALTSRARFSAPQRVATGFAPRRLAVLLAVLERRARLDLGGRDVFLNVVGGLRLVDPAADLAVAAALVSAELDRPTPPGLAFIGEVGLGGEVKAVANGEERFRTALRAGLEGAVLPVASREALRSEAGAHFIAHVREVLDLLEEG